MKGLAATAAVTALSTTTKRMHERAKSSDDLEMRRRVDGGCPEGPGNLDAIRSLRDRNVSTIVCAWGSFPWAARQVARVRPHLYGLEYVCLGMGASGPRHPLYVRYDQRFVPFVF